ncbi:unnamed protein product [Gulo gulo]|uniref:Uncharacterized protein n=1 Tax=Gulo gulo TaxID=48420 RepID=A0A9X9Q453_GULGU|nr:unnamed protein product [Gulo gulo]
MCRKHLPRTPFSPRWAQKSPQASLGGRRTQVQLEPLTTRAWPAQP